MIKVKGNFYHLNLDTINKELKKDKSESVEVGNTETLTYNSDGILIQKEVVKSTKTSTKYDSINLMIDIVLNSEYEYGLDMNKNIIDIAPTNFSLAFNTLLKLGIIEKI